jgi:hypothetical protein
MVKYSKTVHTPVKLFWEDKWANGMATGVDLVVAVVK